MPGRTPREAVDAFVEPLKDIVSCVARAKINLSHGGWGVVGKIHALTVNRDQPITLMCRPVLLLKIGMLYGHTQLAADAVLSYKAHHPTGRISLESVIRTLIAEYDVAATRDDWEAILAFRENDFQIYRTWS